MKAAVLGHPISHSRSPALHRAAYRLLGFECRYDALDVTPADLPAFLQRVRLDPEWRGLSVTMPHKKTAVDLVDRVTGHAATLRVLNTVTVDRTADFPQLTGHNTDVAGIVGALRHAGLAAPPLRPVILGGGGTAAASLAALQELGADRATLYARTPRTAEPLRVLGASLGVDLDIRQWDAAAGALQQADVVISTLPPQGADQLATEIRLPELSSAPVLLDVAYEPWPSPLAAAWEAQGGIIVPGLEMLIYQAVQQVKLFAGSSFTTDADVLKVMCDAVGAPQR